jgi:hypothetical protein
MARCPATVRNEMLGAACRAIVLHNFSNSPRAFIARQQLLRPGYTQYPSIRRRDPPNEEDWYANLLWLDRGASAF